MLAAIDRAAVPTNVEFRVGRAEKMEGVADGTIDLVTVGMRAHWFAREWLGEAKRVLKPGGQVALFMYTTGLPDPATPNVGIILAAMSELKAALMPFHEACNPLVENLYDDLPVPVEGDGWGSVIRCKWLTKAAVKAREPFFLSMTSKVSDMRAALSTGMSMFRWREGHPEVEPEADILTVFVEKVKAAIGETDQTELRMGLDVALVLVQKL